MPKPIFDDKNRVAVSVTRTDKIQKGTFRNKDIGDPGGMTAIIGKTKKDVKSKGLQKAPTKIQSYTLLDEDVNIEKGILKPKTKRGSEEIQSIIKKEGEIQYLGGKQFIPTRKVEEFEGYFTEKQGVKKRSKSRGIQKPMIKRLRNAGVPDCIINKMRFGKELTKFENEELHSKGFEYVRSNKQTSFIRKYTGGTEKRFKNLEKANIKRFME